MFCNRYWVLVKKAPGKALSGCVLPLEDATILELCEDGMAFLWPVIPNREDLCLYCQRQPASPNCQPAANDAYPCNFREDPEAEHQDLDSYAQEGDFSYMNGDFSSLKNFLLCHNCSLTELSVYDLGTLSSISSARSVWSNKQSDPAMEPISQF